MIYRGLCICRPNGLIIAAHDWEGHSPDADIIGTITWEWLEESYREQAITMFTRAAMGHPLPPAIMEFAPDKVIGDYVVQAQYKPTGEPACPVLGVFSMFTRRVLTLTPRSRAVARLLPGHSVAEIAKQLSMTPSAVIATRKRIAAKLDVSLAEIAPFCAILRSIL